MRAFAEPETGLVYRDCAVVRERVDAREAAEHEPLSQVGRGLRREQSQQRAFESLGRC